MGSCGCGCGAGPPGLKPGAVTYDAEEWDHFNNTPEGEQQFRWWADWLPLPDGQAWVQNKQIEARRVVEGMLAQWGYDELSAGYGVIDVGGDPGFVAAELLYFGIPVTVVDPAFGVSGKTDAATRSYLRTEEFHQPTWNGRPPLQVSRKPFDQVFVDDPANADLLKHATALVSLYPDEATDFLLKFTAGRAM